MKVLHLTLKKCWFDMIASGEKREEYREIKPYWDRRFLGKQYDAVQFRNGYSANSPIVLVHLIRIVKRVGRKDWGAPEHPVYVLKLGSLISTKTQN